jgi:hypothetical protein
MYHTGKQAAKDIHLFRVLRRDETALRDAEQRIAAQEREAAERIAHRRAPATRLPRRGDPNTARKIT